MNYSFTPLKNMQNKMEQKIYIQRMISSLTDENLEEVKSIVLKSAFINDKDGAEFLFFTILIIFYSRPKSTHLYIELLQSIKDIFQKFIKKREFLVYAAPLKSYKYFILQLLEMNLITIDLIISRRDFSPEIFNYFAPEIKEFNRSFYVDYNLNYNNESSDMEIKDKEKDKRAIGLNEDPLAVMIRENNISGVLQEVMKPNFSLVKLSQSKFEKCEFLNTNLTMLEYAAFWGSPECFMALAINNSKDGKLPKSTLDFAIAGGALKETIQKYSHMFDFSNGVEEAIKMHRNDYIDFILYMNYKENPHRRKFSSIFQSQNENNQHIQEINGNKMRVINNFTNHRKGENENEIHSRFESNENNIDNNRNILRDDNKNDEENDEYEEEKCKKIERKFNTNDFHNSILYYNLEIFMEILPKAINILNRPATTTGLRPIHLAALISNNDIFKILAEISGIEIDVRYEDDHTPLYTAIERENEGLVRFLLERADVDVNQRFDNSLEKMYGYTPFLFAIQYSSPDILKWIIMCKRTDLKVTLKNGMNALHLAVRSDDLEKVKIINELGIFDIHKEKNTKYSPKICNKHSDPDGFIKPIGHIKLANSSEPKVIYNSTNNSSNNNSIVLAFSDCNVEMEEFYQNNNNNNYDDDDIINNELSGTKILSMRKKNKTDNEYSPLWLSLESEDVEIFKYLLECYREKQATEFDLNEKDQEGNTMLHIACLKGKSEHAKLLCSLQNVDVNAQNNANRTPLHIAFMYNNDIDIIKTLTNTKNINFDVVDKNGYLPLNYAMNNKKIIHETVSLEYMGVYKNTGRHMYLTQEIENNKLKYYSKGNIMIGMLLHGKTDTDSQTEEIE